MDVSKNRGGKPPKMDGENNGKPYEQMDDLGENVHLFLGWHPYSQLDKGWWHRTVGTSIRP